MNLEKTYSLAVEQWLKKEISIEKTLEGVIETVDVDKLKQKSFVKKTADKIEKLIEEGKNLVKPELQDEWRKFVFSCCAPLPGSLGITETETAKGCVKFMKALSNGKACQEAEKDIFDEGFGWVLTRYSYLVATHSICLHPRGKEYWHYWQGQNRPELDIMNIDLA